MARALGMNGSVQMTAVGRPAFSRVIPSCTLHDEQDPQSPFPVITTSQLEARSSTMSVGQGLEAFPLLRAMTALNSNWSARTSCTISRSSSAFRLPFAKQADYRSVQRVGTLGDHSMRRYRVNRRVEHFQHRRHRMSPPLAVSAIILRLYHLRDGARVRSAAPQRDDGRERSGLASGNDNRDAFRPSPRRL